MTAGTMDSGLQVVTFEDPNIALGFAVRITLKHPAFARRPFGEWADVLVGQARRGHQLFVLDEARELRGFLGYAITSRANAEAWAHAGRRLASDECLQGDCVILNAWISSDAKVRRIMLNAFRQIGLHKQAYYFRRAYPNGSVRTSQVNNNAFVASHLARAAAKHAQNY